MTDNELNPQAVTDELPADTDPGPVPPGETTPEGEASTTTIEDSGKSLTDCVSASSSDGAEGQDVGEPVNVDVVAPAAESAIVAAPADSNAATTETAADTLTSTEE